MSCLYDLSEIKRFVLYCIVYNKFIIFSDSLSVLKAMNHTSSKNPQIQKLLEKCHEL